MTLRLRGYMPMIAFLCLLSVSLSLSAQETFDKLIVIDRLTEEPVPNVTVYSNGKVVGFTDMQGVFPIQQVYNQKDMFSFTCIGYEKTEADVKTLRKERFRVFLEQDNTKIDEVTVVANRENLNPYINYQVLAPLKEEMHSYGSVLYGDTIYVQGGVKQDSMSKQELLFTSLYKYSIIDNRWVKDKNKFARRGNHAMHAYDDKLYILGGQTYFKNIYRTYLENTIEVYDIKTGSTLRYKGNPHTAINFASMQKDDYLILAGGAKRIKVVDNFVAYTKHYFNHDIHLFEIPTKQWYKLGELQEGREMNGIIVNEVIYLMGGFSSLGASDVIESLNPSTGETTTEARLIYRDTYPGMVSDGSLIYIFSKNIIYVFDTVTKKIQAYLIDLHAGKSTLYIDRNQLFILASEETECGLYSISMDEFSKTKDIYDLWIERKQSLEN